MRKWTSQEKDGQPTGNRNKVRAMARTHQERLAHLERLRQRRIEALRLREEEKYTVQQVGDALGVSKQLASRIIMEAVAERDGA